MNNPVELNFSGMLMKHVAIRRKENVLVQSQIKCSDAAEVREIVRELDKYGVSNLGACVPAYDIPWPKLTIPLDDYSLFFKVNFGADRYTGENGEIFSAKLTQLSFTSKRKGDEDILECTLTFLKNADDEINDTRFNAIFLKIKEDDPETGKKRYTQFPVKLTQCESFMLGDAVTDESDDSDAEPVVFEGN